MNHSTLSERIARIARKLQDAHDPLETMQTAVDLAAAEVDGCDGAALSIVHRRRRVDTPAATSETARMADQLQYELGEGPCLDAVWEERLVHSSDLATDPRWPTWGPKVAAETGARSIMCFQLFTEADTVGALNLYSERRGSFDAEDRDSGVALAAHVAVAVRAAQQVQSMSEGLESRTVIGQAQGILMERFEMDEEHAFALLSRLSQDTNTRLRSLADEIVRTRQVPSGDPA